MRRIERDGVGLAVHEQGDGPAVLLLHGVPDSYRVWRHQVPALTGAGLRAVLPDLRGLGASDKPPEAAAYRFPEAVADALAVLGALDVERAHVVGHDFGAVIAWLLAALHPERVDRLVTISVGHPATFGRRSIAAREKRGTSSSSSSRRPRRSCPATTGGCCASGSPVTATPTRTSATSPGRGR